MLNTSLTIFIPAPAGHRVAFWVVHLYIPPILPGIPRELDDAAYIDGCSVPGTFLRIMVPNASSAFVSCFLFSFVWYWNDFYQTSMYFNEPVTVTMALGMLQDTLRGASDSTTGRIPYLIVTRMQAACVLAILPMLVIYIFLQRFFREYRAHGDRADPPAETPGTMRKGGVSDEQTQKIRRPGGHGGAGRRHGPHGGRKR